MIEWSDPMEVPTRKYWTLTVSYEWGQSQVTGEYESWDALADMVAWANGIEFITRVDVHHYEVKESVVWGVIDRQAKP